MGFKCGIIGLPNVGKSTIFNALTTQHVASSNYPFCTIEPNIGIVPLEDERLDNIHKLIGSEKKTPTTLEFVDIAGLVKGASKGEGLGNQFLNHIQAVDAIAHVVRCFEDSNVVHTSSVLDPLSDCEIIITELILKDLEIIEKRLERIQSAIRTGDKKLKSESELLLLLKDKLERNIQLKHIDLAEDQKKIIKALNLLTLKPAIFIANIGENNDQNENQLFQKVKAFAENLNEQCIPFCAKVQAELAELDSETRDEFIQELGIDELGLSKIVKTGYKILNLITFFTANKNEAHAWTIPGHTTVVKAAGKIHTDFEKGFIKAEIIKYNDLMKYKAENKLREKGLIAIHGKEYIVEDGDLIFFRFST